LPLQELDGPVLHALRMARIELISSQILAVGLASEEMVGDAEDGVRDGDAGATVLKRRCGKPARRAGVDGKPLRAASDSRNRSERPAVPRVAGFLLKDSAKARSPSAIPTCCS
jgi:hypothetical protein